MENEANNRSNDVSQSERTHTETDYEKHQNNPAPGPTVNEPDNKGAGQAMKWIIPIAIILLLIIWFFFFRNNVSD